MRVFAANPGQDVIADAYPDASLGPGPEALACGP